MEFLINEEIPKQLSKSPILTPRFISQIMSGRGPKLVEMNREFLSSIKNSTNEEATSIAVKACQYSVIPLLDKLMQWLPESEVERIHNLDPDDEGYYLFKHLHELLYCLHFNMERNFYRYMDHEYKIPDYNRYLFKGIIMDALVSIKSSPRFRSLDSRLQHIVVGPLEKVVAASGDEYLTYHSRDYIGRLASQLLGFVKKDDDDVWQLYNRLQYIDFNSSDYIRYLTARFREECTAIKDHRKRYIWLLERRKRIAHQLMQDEASFQAGRRPVKALLDEWLKWEIYYAKRMMDLEMTGR